MFCEWHKQSDPFHGTNIYLPPSAVAGALIGKNRPTNPWKPFAGLRRGTFACIGLSQNYTNAEMDELLENQINPLTRFGGSYALIDNLTMLTYNSAFSNLNIRFLFDYITEVSEDYLLTFVQEYNDEATR
ncbi:unnamed protein product, partial [marine sediment metagenome]